MAGETLKWTIGLLNSGKKYLTAETFQSKVTCNGNTLKKKQLWTLESISGDDIALKTSSNKYLTCDKDGNLDCSGEDVSTDQKFSFVFQDDGQVAIKTSHGRYVGGSGDMMSGFDKSIGPSNLFIIHLAIHPQVNIFNVNRKKYIHYNEEANQLCCTELIPWGYDATIILEFHDGKYALRAANSSYLKNTGELVEAPSADTLYTLVFRGSQIAFKDCKGKYLTAVGHTATVQSRKTAISKDELFELIDSKPQVQLTASNGKLLSIREGIEVRAKQTEVTDKEIFQMEPANSTDFSGNVKWSFRSCNNSIWDSGSGSSVTSNADCASDATHFSIEWMGSRVALKAANGKYVSMKPNGQMAASSSELTDQCYLILQFINRPFLVIKGDYGFVGVKGATSGTLDCNRSQYDVFSMGGTDGTCNFKGANGKYFKIEGDQTLSVNGDSATEFFLKLCAPSRMVIVTPDGKFLKGQQNGAFTATGDRIAANTLWEY